MEPIRLSPPQLSAVKPRVYTEERVHFNLEFTGILEKNPCSEMVINGIIVNRYLQFAGKIYVYCP